MKALHKSIIIKDTEGSEIYSPKEISDTAFGERSCDEISTDSCIPSLSTSFAFCLFCDLSIGAEKRLYSSKLTDEQLTKNPDTTKSTADICLLETNCTFDSF